MNIKINSSIWILSILFFFRLLSFPHLLSIYAPLCLLPYLLSSAERSARLNILTSDPSLALSFCPYVLFDESRYSELINAMKVGDDFTMTLEKKENEIKSLREKIAELDSVSLNSGQVIFKIYLT